MTKQSRDYIEEQFERRLDSCTVEEYPKIAREYSIWKTKQEAEDFISNKSIPAKTKKQAMARVRTEPI